MALVKAAALALAITAIVATAPAAAPTATRSPNIVLIVADDLGPGDLGAYGGRRIRTPNIDELAADGIRFTQAYASANVCSPSRAGLMTGRYAIRSGLAWKVIGADDERGLPQDEETLAGIVRRAGYATLYVGKWHLGNRDRHSPLRHGFEHFFGVLHSNDMPDFALYRDATRIEQPVDQRRLTEHYTQAATEFIAHTSSRPFLLVVAHTAPHIPLHPSQRFRGRSAAGLYGDVVEELDWSTGEILAALRRAGVARDTLVVFTSDNGPFFEGSAGGLRGGKGNVWEGGYRVPLIARWPAVIRPRRTATSMTMNIDLLPTVAEAVGVRPTAAVLDGRSLLPVFRGADRTAHEYLYFFNNETVVGLRTAEWKLVTHAYYTTSLGSFENFARLPGFDGPYELLFDRRGMDDEAYGVGDREPRILNRLREELRRARAEFDPLRTHAPEPVFPQ
ncbi:MAG: sulfatase [Steroidobacteraceae bacterium]